MLHFRWDLDKTYIHTDFDSLKDLVRTFWQAPEDKRSIAAAPTLLRALLSPPEGADPRRVTFISGSPRQMRRVLTEKLRLDGVEPDAFVLKPNLSNLLKFRFRALNEQLGYKLSALLASRFGGSEVQEVLVVDDSEADARIYSLYADIIGGAIRRETVEDALRGSKLYRSDVDHILSLVDGLPLDRPSVRRIFIHLDRRSPTARFDAFGARVVPVYNYFQAALVLFDMELLLPRSLLAVVDAMDSADYSPTRLTNSAQDIVRRGYVRPAALFRARESALQADEIMGRASSLFVAEFADALASVEPVSRKRAWVGDIDYVELCADTDRYRRRKAVLRGVGLLRDS
jgi:hypothetical protein